MPTYLQYEFGKKYANGTRVWLYGVLREVAAKPGSGGRKQVLRKVHPEQNAGTGTPPARSLPYYTRELIAN